MAAIQVKVPSLGESVTSAVLIKWHKQDGEQIAADEPVCELETDKANVDVPAPAAGVVKRTKKEGDTVNIGEVIASIDPDAKPAAAAPKATALKGDAAVKADKAAAARAEPEVAASGIAPEKISTTTGYGTNDASGQKPAAAVTGTGAGAPPAVASTPSTPGSVQAAIKPEDFSPAVRRLLDEHDLNPDDITPTGPGGRLTKEDVLNYLEEHQDDQRATDAEPAAAAPIMAASPVVTPGGNGQGVRRAPMSRIRKRIAENLVRAQQTAAILTTFNEIDLQAVMDLRSKFKERFEKLHGVGLGFMSFFAKACTQALKEFPKVNSQIEGDDVVSFDYVHLGIAVSTERGLAVPVLRNAHQMSFVKIESEIKRLANATRDGKLGLEELSGGTFTITNGGVFGSLLSTPIINPPQSAILGMHKIQERPVVVNGQIVIRPMMYVALSYDHRLVDGRESVSFLVRVKELIEDPSRLMLEV